jgi:saposin
MFLLLVAVSLCDPVPCDLCIFALKEVAGGVARGVSDSEITQAVTDACPFFPRPSSVMCNTLFGQLPAILTDIHAGLSPEAICTKLESCFAHRRPRRIRSSRTCETCKVILKTAKTFPDYPPDKLFTALLPYCSAYSGGARDYCLDLAAVALPVVLTSQRSSDEICASAEFCTAPRRPRVVRQISNSLPCDFCLSLARLLKGLTKDRGIDENIASLVYRHCQGWPAPIPVCASIVDEYVAIMLDLLEIGLEPVDLCGKISFCSGAAARQNQAAPGDPICDFCQSLVNMVIEWLADEKTRDEIRELAVEACQELPDPYSSLCAAYVNEFVDQVIDWIEEGIEELEICQRLGLCGAPKAVKAKRGDNVPCEMCRDLVHYLRLVWWDGRPLEVIVQTAEDMCLDFPPPAAEICKDLLDRNLPDIVEWIDDGLAVTHVCADLGYCPPTRKRRN